MDVINTSPALDCKTMIAILNGNPDGVAILGAFNGMETLAREDPEGCVRLSPGLPMDNTALASLLHCTETIVEKTIEVFGKLKRLNVKDGLIRVFGYGESGKAGIADTVLNENYRARKSAATEPALTEEALAKKRLDNRLRKAKSRARQKQEQETAAETNVTTVTPVTNRDMGAIGCDRRDMKCDSERDMRDNLCDMECDSRCDQGDGNTQTRTVTGIPKSVTGCDNKCDMRDSQCDTEYTATASGNRNINIIYPLHAPYAHKHISKYQNIIPLKVLPEAYRNVLDVWNKLPLPKYKGLVPELMEKLRNLMQRYGKNTLCKTIADIANNPFLLGRKEGHTWSVSLGWLLEPANFAKVLSGKYSDEKINEDNCSNWHPGERLPFFLPGEGPEGFTPEEQRQVLHNLFTPTTPAQLKAARLVGLPGYREVSA